MTQQTVGEIRQKGPRAHHFVALISMTIGISFIFESYTLSAPFALVTQWFGVDGKIVWGGFLVTLGILLLLRVHIVFRALILILCTLVWVLFGGLALWASVFGPSSGTIGSYSGILSIAIAATAILAAGNLRRDF